MVNPLSDQAETDDEDRELVSRAQAGSRDALERLITRHQAWIYNIVLRMLYWPRQRQLSPPPRKLSRKPLPMDAQASPWS